MPIDSSKFFDSIRIKPNKLSAKQQAAAREAATRWTWGHAADRVIARLAEISGSRD